MLKLLTSLGAAVRTFIDHDGFLICGNIAYCLLLAIFPFLLFLAGLTTLITGDVNAQTIIEYLFSIAPETIVKPIANEINNLLATDNSSLMTISLLLTFWTGLAAVESIRGGLNKAYNVVESRAYWLRLLQDIMFIFVGIIGIILLGILLLFAPLLVAMLQVYFPTFADLITQFNIWSYPLGVLLLTTILFTTHALLPNQRPKLKKLLPGVVFSVVIWLAMAEIFTLYLESFSRYAAIYGSLGGIIATMVFIYISAVIFMLGSEFNQSLK
ncbi:MAG: YihY/virulence factor BrkB family protein [Rhizobiales bacterium]|nr:YihY/virulence factor BrkB family protein [Hyphomicrobiales bacterium]NRB13608.1 YihY/virulence factor BrkB family protein [Hyphomicrobiales bacterium]